VAAEAVAGSLSENASVKHAARQLASVLAHDLTAGTEVGSVAALVEPYKLAIPAVSNETRLMWFEVESIGIQAAMLLETEVTPVGTDATERSITLPRAQAERLKELSQNHDPSLENAGVESVESTTPAPSKGTSSPSYKFWQPHSGAASASFNALIVVASTVLLALM
jgi:hypothetical protein